MITGQRTIPQEIPDVAHAKVRSYEEDFPHRVVERVLSLFSSRRKGDSLTPSPAGECLRPPPPVVLGEGHTRLREREWESPNSDEGTDTAWYSIGIYVLSDLP
jgi:hypothetical protein